LTRVTHDRQSGELYLIAGGYHRRAGLHPERLLADILSGIGIRSPVVACLGFAPLVCDTHEEDDHWPELRTMVGISPARTIGYGIVSGASLRVAPGGTLAAMGGPVHRFARRDAEAVRLPDLEPLPR
jgi:hypothetical protein